MQHPVWGAAMVKGCVSEGALLAIRHHHEWWNGKGYPEQLAGDDIPIEARIVGIADAFVAMREERPYRPPRSRQEAVGELEQGAGTQFDPQLVDPLLESIVGRQPAAAPRRALIARAIRLATAKDSRGRGVIRTCAGGRPLRMTAAGSSSAHSSSSLTRREGDGGLGTNGG